MHGYHHSQTVAALIRHEDTVLLVEQQGPADPAPTWALPGGRVEPGELPTEAMIREVREETGLVVTDPGHLLYVRAGVHRTSGESSSTLVFEPARWQGELAPDDPDGLLRQAQFLPLDDALAKLGQLPWAMMREPIVGHLCGQAVPGALWLYRYTSHEDATLVSVVGGVGP